MINLWEILKKKWKKYKKTEKLNNKLKKDKNFKMIKEKCKKDLIKIILKDSVWKNSKFGKLNNKEKKKN